MPDEQTDEIPGNSFEAQMEHQLQACRLAASSRATTVNVCGVPVDSLTLRGFLRAVCIQISQRLPGYVVTPNIDHVCRYHTNREFRDAYQHALLSLPDGTPLVWASRLLKTPLREKLSGSDMVYRLSEFAAAKGFKVYFLGAAEGVAAEAANRLATLCPGLTVVGIDSPPMGFEQQPDLNDQVVERLAQSNADICFVALGSPKQEIWMRQNSGRCRVPVMIGIGASLDFVAGRVKRAPVWMQRSGLEWFWRLCQEPRRLWRRYLVHDTFFFWLLGLHIATQIRTRLRSPSGA
jgi:N-acetylglucosaminyldiphosphoundecaprenol N-acetyl-beta-D-mannosaminyltransferase